MECMFFPVPHRKGEHAHEFGDRFFQSPSLDRFQNDFRVRMALKRTPKLFQIPTQFGEIINLPIVRYDQSSAPGDHGLGPGGRKIDNGQSPVTEGHSRLGVDPNPFIVRSPMLKRPRHR